MLRRQPQEQNGDRKHKRAKDKKDGKEEWVDWNNYFGHLFAKGYLADDTIQDVVEKNLGKILLVLVLILLTLFGSVRSFLKRSLRRSIAPQSTVFCRHNRQLCEYNRYVKALLYDFRQSRDIVNNPDGTHNVVTPGFNKLDVCQMPVQLYYADKRIEQYWGHILGKQKQGLAACKTPCIVTHNKSDADVLIGMFDPPYENKEWWQRTGVVSLEAHSLNARQLAATDILVSFHKQSDVQVNYVYGLSHGIPCSLLAPSRRWSSVQDTTDTHTHTTDTHTHTTAPHCLSPAIEAQMKSHRPNAPALMTERMGQRKSKAVLFMSRLCSRHDGFAEKLMAAINWEIGVDSYGKCFRNIDEKQHTRYVGSNAEASKERITNSYKFNIVIENAIVDDYVTEKFYEGLKSASLMVYLGAPNIGQYAPAAHSFINVLDTPDLPALASLLIDIDKNQTLYDSYFQWRRDRPPSLPSTPDMPESAEATSPSLLPPRGISEKFEALQDFNFARDDHFSWQCRMCGVYIERYCSNAPVHVVTMGDKPISFLDV